jgi:phage baseplate assembly protein W
MTVTNPYVNRNPDYSDLDMDFVANPATGDVNILNGEQAIKRSVRNLVLTNYYERKFNSQIGSDVSALLFDLAGPLTVINIQDAIKGVINNFEPRVSLQNVTVKDDSDNNGYNVTLEYIILNRNSPVISTMFLERIR